MVGGPGEEGHPNEGRPPDPNPYAGCPTWRCQPRPVRARREREGQVLFAFYPYIFFASVLPSYLFQRA